MSILVKFNPHDIWVGCYWQRAMGWIDIYICLIPMLPIRITIFTGKS